MIFLGPLAEALYAMLLSIAGPSLAPHLFLVASAFILFNLCAMYAMFGGLWERKLIARAHSRIGPMYTGPWGLLQTAADAIKFLKKEVIYPRGSDRALFAAAPLMMLVAPFVTIIFVPVGSFVLVQSEYSLLIALALLSFTPIAILVGAWASNSKYSTLGGLRSAGMTMSYEVLISVAVASVILSSGSFSIAQIVQHQHDAGLWFVAMQPVAAVLFLIGLIASVERNPFDLVEAESELVGGWKTEYGGVYFSLTLLAEYAKLLVSIMLFVSVFLGGWMGWLGDLGFILKVLFMTAFMFYVRATAMRMRLDQVFTKVWARLIPLGLLNMVATAAFLLGGTA